MICCLLAGLLVPAGITLSLPAVSLKDACAEISKQTPSPVYVEGKLANEMVCISIKNMPQGELEQNLAKVSTGEWTEREGKKILTLPAWKEAQQLEDTIKDRREAIAEAKAKLTALGEVNNASLQRMIAQAETTVVEMRQTMRSDSSQYEKARQRLFDLLNEFPVSRLLTRIIANFKPDDLARLEPGLRVCYSNRPNRVERAFPFSIREILEVFRKEQSLLKKQLTQPTKFDLNLPDDWRYLIYEATPDVAKLLVIFQTDRTTGLPTFRLLLGDEQGEMVGTNSRRLTRNNPPLTSGTSLPEINIPLTPDQSAIIYAIKAMSSPSQYDTEAQRNVREIIMPTLQWLSQVQQHEPLADLTGPCLIEVAKQSGKDLIALLPDRAMRWLPAGTTIKSSDLSSRITGRSATSFARPWDAVLDNAPDLITIWPRLPWQWRDERIHRPALGRLFRNTLAQGSLTVLESAIYLGACQSSTAYEFWSYDSIASGFGESMQGAFVGRDLSIWYYRDMLRLLGSLPEIQLRNLLNGGEVGVAQLKLDKLERCLFGRDHFLGLFTDRSRSWQDQLIRGRRLDEEVWEMLPNGIPASFRLTCRRTDQDTILVEEGDIQLQTSLTPEDLGERLADEEWAKAEKTMRLAKAVQYEFRFVISPTVSGVSELGETTPGKRTKVRNLDDLPANIRERVAKGLADERRRQANQSRTTTGPPPP